MGGRNKRSVVYPARQRCFKCRKFFGLLVLLGLYCSFPCAGIPYPGDNAALGKNKTRACENNGRGRRKRRWDSLADADAFAARDASGGLSAYECVRCHGYHVGHSRGGAK